MTIKFNTQEFIDDFRKTCEATIELKLKDVEKIAKKLYADVKEATPVGDPSLWNSPASSNYVPGSLQDAWTYTEIERSKDGFTIEIANRLPYAERVEYGWSTQAPNGMLRLAILDLAGVFNIGDNT